jgi:anti-anti-sigma factor
MAHAFEAVPVLDPPTLKLRGEFDVEGEPLFDDALAVVTSASPPSLIVDVTELEFIGSTGLRSLVKAKRAVGDVVVLGADPWIRRVLQVASLDSVLRFADDRESA